MARKNSLKNVLRLLDEVEDVRPVEDCFLSDLKRSIELNDKKNRRKSSQMYKPSSMGCVRNMYYQRIGIEPENQDVSYVLVGICNSGTDIHVRVQTAVSEMKENGIDCEYIDVAKFVKQRELEDVEVVSQVGMETKLRHNKYHLSFMCDGIIRYKGKYYILELKTETMNKWFSRKGVDPAHHAQGTCYSLALGLDNVIFIYINRDTLDMKSYMFTPTQEMLDEIIDKIKYSEECVEKQTAPMKPADVQKKSCTYCNYKERCRQDG